VYWMVTTKIDHGYLSSIKSENYLPAFICTGDTKYIVVIRLA
jgi:hypothetical protein